MAFVSGLDKKLESAVVNLVYYSLVYKMIKHSKHKGQLNTVYFFLSWELT